MNRRFFTALMATAALGAALPVRADVREGEGPREDFLAPVELQTPARVWRPRWFLIAGQGALWGVDLRQPVPRYNENRIDLGSVPLLGGLVRPNLGRLFAGVTPVGAVVATRTHLVLLPDEGVDLGGRDVFIANGDWSWEAGQTQGLRYSRLPSRTELDGRPRLGTAYLKDRALLVVVEPARVRPRD